MAVNRTHIDAPPEDVFALWADGDRYADWVVGAKRIRTVEPNWPAPGSEFHHTVGAGPLTTQDKTVAREVEQGKRLVLDARARPLGRARVELIVRPDGTGSEVEMREELVGPAPLRLLVDPLIHLRNVEALRRLEREVTARV